MSRVNVFEVKAKLSEYLDRVLQGERVVICRHNKPVAELRAIEETRTEPRPIGPLPGRPAFDVSPAFFEPLPDEELDLWDGGSAAVSSALSVPPSRGRRASKVAERKAQYRPGRARGRSRS